MAFEQKVRSYHSEKGSKEDSLHDTRLYVPIKERVYETQGKKISLYVDKE